MAQKTKKKHTMEWIAGGVILLAAGVLLALVIWVVNALDFSGTPPATTPAPSVTQNRPTVSPAPTMAANPYGPGDFEYKNGYLTCVSGPSVLGIDVSEFQGQIDWQAVATTDVKIAMIRLGFRAWGEKGEVVADAYAKANLQGAKEAGLKVGVYFFSQAITVEEARQEARFVLAMLDGQSLDMPVVFDWETVADPTARTANMTKEKLNACAIAFCQEIQAAGYRAMVYFNPDIASRLMDILVMEQMGFELWLAMYTDVMTYPYQVDMWQYSCGGKVKGILVPVDMNLYFTYEE